MKRIISALLLPLLLAQAMPSRAAQLSRGATESIQQSQESVTPLSNRDVLLMVKANLTAEVIIAKIKSSVCNFETTPDVLEQLKTEGVPDAVLLAMVMAPRPATPNGKSTAASGPPESRKVQIPFGTVVEVEAAFTVTSQEVREGDLISFRVVYPVLAEGRILIEPGATATARVVKASRGGHFGRAGRLAWTMLYVVAVDGTKIPIQSSGRLVGDSKAAKVATAAILTGAVFWIVAPVGLLQGFKRGENAILPAGKRFEVFVQEGATVNVVSQAKQ